MPIEDIVIVNGSQASPPIAEGGFGVEMILSAEPSFTERVRYYGSKEEVFADAESGITSSGTGGDLITALFSQTLPPGQIALGRVDDLEEASGTFTVDSVDAGGGTVTMTVAYHGVTTDYVYTYAAAETAEECIDGLIALVEADGSAVIGVTDDGTSLDWAGVNPGYTPTITGSASTGGAVSVAVTEAGTDLSTLMDAIFAEDPEGWYCVSHGEFFAAEHAYDLGVWIEATNGNIPDQRKRAVMTLKESDIADNVDTDILSRLQALSLQRSMVFYLDESGVGGVQPAACLAADRMSVDPDDRSASWANVTLPGCTVPASGDYSTTVQNRIENKGGNLYGRFSGVGVTWPAQQVNGSKPDNLTALDVLCSRVRSDVATDLIQKANAANSDPATNDGANVIRSITARRIGLMIAAGHFTPGYVISIPDASVWSVSRRVPVTVTVNPAGAIEAVTETIYLDI